MIRTRSNNHDLTPLIIGLAVFIAVYLIGLHFAHAGVAATAGPPAAGIDWTFWIALLGLALALASHVLHYIAPRTKATWDDNLRDDVDWLLKAVKDAKPTAPEPPPRSPQAGFVRFDAMLWLAFAALVAIGGGLVATSCTKEQLKADAVTAGRALVNCTAQNLGTVPGLDLATLAAVVNLGATERAKCSPSGSLDWQCVKNDLIAQGVVLGGCTLVAMVTDAAKAFTSAGDRLSAETPVLPGRAEFLEFRALVAPGATYHTGAGDL